MSNIDVRALREKIENINTLPTIPKVLKKILGVIENPRISLNEISNFVSDDPALTIKVLKMVNSPIYGFPGRISSVNRAAILLGLTVVKGLLLDVSVFELMQKHDRIVGTLPRLGHSMQARGKKKRAQRTRRAFRRQPSS
jgi:HD-like signal output (HDOD) protein